MDLKSRIKLLFNEGILLEKKPDAASILGKKKVIKGLGRKGVKKSKSKRKNNFKTQDARRILASKHGVSKALKKDKNKYVMTYDEIAKLMRHYSYSFNKDKGKWLRKKPSTGSSSSAPTSSSPKSKETPSSPEKTKKSSSKSKIKVQSEDDITDNLKSDKTTSIKTSADNTDIDNSNYLSKESMKSYQARLISYLLNDNTEEGGWYDAIQLLKSPSGSLEFYLPKTTIYEYLDNSKITWIEERQVWIDIEGNYPIPEENHGGRHGITARAILANEGYTNFLDVNETSDQEALDTAQELGYTWFDGMWKKLEAPKTESLQKRTFPELITKDLIGKI
jgi:hypothetical protein